MTLASVQATAALSTIELIGLEQRLDFEQRELGLEVRLPALGKVMNACGPGCQWAFVLRMRNVQPRDSKEDLMVVEPF